MSTSQLQSLIALCDEYRAGTRAFTGKPEEITKQNLIEPLLEHLSWSKTPDDDYYEREFRGKVKGVEWKDIVLLTDNEPRIFVETKACSDSGIHAKYAKELLTYLKDYNADKIESEWVTWGILTNFTETLFYHWSEPISNPTPFYTVGYKELPERFQELKALISPEGIRNNRLLNSYLESPAHKLDEDFLQDLKKWRLIIANGLYRRNSSLSLEKLSELSHILLSRLIFIRRLEAIGVLQPHWLKNQYTAWREGKTLPMPTFAEYLRELVRSFWKLYDTELFEEQECDRCDFEDSYFKDLLKYIDVPIADVRLITGTEKLQDRGLYGYKFGELTLDILGAVYERYLAHKLEFKLVKPNSGSEIKVVTIEETAELRQKEGAYFTPPHIVNFILARTLEPKVRAIFDDAAVLLARRDFQSARKKIDEISRIRILDPAAGSGSFIIAAFKILAHYYSAYNRAVAEEFSKLPSLDNRSLDFQVDKVTERILLQNLFCVDLDPKAVEMTKLNLWLHHIDYNRHDYQYEGGRAVKKLLPTLDLNIQVGNSLIDGGRFDPKPIAKQLERIVEIRRKLSEIRIALSRNRDDKEIIKLQTEDGKLKEELDRLVKDVESDVNATVMEYNAEDMTESFNWTVRFPEVFADGGFDVYVGNPPYINLYKFTDQFRDYLSKRDPEIFNAKNDLLYHFCKRGIELLKEAGSLGYIVSRYFLEAENADLLRGYLTNTLLVRILVDYGNVEIFKGVNIRSVVLVCDKSTAHDNIVRVGKVRGVWSGSPTELTQLFSSHIENGEYHTPDQRVAVFDISQATLGNEPWRLLSPLEMKVRENLEKDSWRLGGPDGLCDMGMGMQTGLDRAFRVTSQDIDREHIPSEFVRTLVRNGDIRRYTIYDRGEFWIYTEDTDIDSLPDSHPVKRHLKRFKDALNERYPCRTCSHCSETFPSHAKMMEHWKKEGLRREERLPKRRWYEYTVPNIKELFNSTEKIIVPYKAPSNRFAIDKERRISSMDVYICVAKKQEGTSIVGHYYLLALLNSSLMDYSYITFYARRKKSEFEYYTGLLERIPIRKPNSKTHDALEKCAEQLTAYHKIRNDLEQLFQRRLDSVEGKIGIQSLKHYYTNPQAYAVSDKEWLHPAKGLIVGSDHHFTLYRVGVEEEDSSLWIDAEFQVGSDPKRRERVLRIRINDEKIRSFLLYSIKLYVSKSRGRKSIGNGKDLLDIILNSVEVFRLRTNTQENRDTIHSLMDEFDSQAPTKTGISTIERKILDLNTDIDELVYELYDLDAESREMLRGMYRYDLLSEYFDRVEEYLGVEDIQ
jgi:type I restriction-modification system DNA methylase subunit